MINVQYLDLPCHIHGLIRENEDGSATVILNSRDSWERNLQAYRHELNHLLRDDFCEADVQTVEAETHKEDCNGEP